MFVVFEGIEGSGKSTQIRLLADWFRGRGREVLTLREPGGTPLGESIRGLLLERSEEPPCPTSEALLFAAARAQLVARRIQPALARGAVVLSDRFVDSSLVYQGIARGLGVESVRSVNAFALAGCRPERTILLDLPAEQGLARAAARSAGDRFEDEALAFHRRVRRGFLELAGALPAGGRPGSRTATDGPHAEAAYLVLDASLPIDALAEQIRAGLGLS